MQTRTLLWPVAALVAILCTVASLPLYAATIPLWGRFEHEFKITAPHTGESPLLVEFTAPSGKRWTVDGFYDGASTWRVRFMPNEEGKWIFRSSSMGGMPGLHGISGTFHCAAEKSSNRFNVHGAIRVAKNSTHLEHADGTPFFWLGDTVWNGPMLSTKADWDFFLEDRVGKQFTGIQFNAIAPWRTAPTDEVGQVAITGESRIRINPAYFQRLDKRMDTINAHGLLAAPVLIWANRKTDLGNTLSEEDVIKLVRYQVARYGAHHVLWILAGDNGYGREAAERWKRVGRAVFGDRPHAPVTTHPTGMNWPWESWRNEAWLDVLGYQSGHGDDARTVRWIHSGPPNENWQKQPARPIINLEPPYENHNGYQSRKPHSAYSVRRAVYWSLLSTPIAGVTYGGHGIWSWQTEVGQEPRDHKGTGIAKVWREAKDLTGSAEMGHMAKLVGSLPWWHLQPAPDLLFEQPGGDDPTRHVAAARTTDERVAVLYLPVGGSVKLRLGNLATAKANWFDPRTAQTRAAERDEAGVFAAPDTQDWVLVLSTR